MVVAESLNVVYASANGSGLAQVHFGVGNLAQFSGWDGIVVDHGVAVGMDLNEMVPNTSLSS